MASKKKPSRPKPKKPAAAVRPQIIYAAPPPPTKPAKPEGPGYEDARVFLELVALTFTPHFAASRDWYLGKFEAKDLTDFRSKYPDDSEEFSRFWTSLGWFETAGVLMKNKLLNPDLFFDRFAVGPFWNKAKIVVHALQKESGQKELFENFEWLVRREQGWHKNRSKAPKSS